MSNETNRPRPEGDGHPNHFVKEWREFMGWSQEELGAMVHASQSKIARVESGERGLKTGFLRDIARKIGVPPSAVLEVNPSTESGAQTAHLLLAWDKLTTGQRADVLKMVRALGSPEGKSNAS